MENLSKQCVERVFHTCLLYHAPFRSRFLAKTLMHSQNLLIGTVSMIELVVLFPTSFDAVTLKLNKLHPVPSGSGYNSLSVIVRTCSLDVRFVICK